MSPLEKAKQLQTAVKAKFSLGSSQIQADEDITERVQLFQRIFAPEDLHENGIESDVHVTVFYGFDDSVDVAQVAEVVGRFTPFTIKFDDIGLFENPEFDVVKVSVESDQLRELNARLSALPNQNERMIYQPHLTLAYVKPGRGKKYLINPLDDETMRVTAVVFSDKDGNKAPIPLAGAIEREEDDDEMDSLSYAKELQGEATKQAPPCALCGRPSAMRYRRGNPMMAQRALPVCQKCGDRLDAVTMKPGKPDPSIKNPKVYESMIKRGYDKSQAAAISNALVAHRTKEVESGDTSVGLTIYKQANGTYRWVARSSNAYRDRDSQIVSQKALEDDVQRADTTKEYGTLRFWHMPGVDIGDCDFNWMRGRTLIESGTFRDPAVAEKVAQKAADYQISIGFRHPHDEPDLDGVFHNIRRFERSLVPAGRAANPFTSLSVTKEKQHMNDQVKTAALKALLDGDEAQVKEILAGAENSEKAADAMGISFKEASLNFDSVDALLDYAISAKEAELAKSTEEAEKAATPPEPAKEPTKEDPKAPPMDDYATKMDGMITKMGGYMDRMEKMFGKTTKEADDVTAVTLATNQHSERIATTEATVKELADKLEATLKELDELKSDIPAGIGVGVRPTEQTDNIVGTVEKSTGGVATQANDFLSFIVEPNGR